MDVKIAANKMRDMINDSFLSEADEGDASSKAHLLGMCRKIEEGEVTGEKAHRWLGWIQGCVYKGSAFTLVSLAVGGLRVLLGV